MGHLDRRRQGLVSTSPPAPLVVQLTPASAVIPQPIFGGSSPHDEYMDTRR